MTQAKYFDLNEPKFFSTTAHEAAAMDPQQRILLEVSYEAFENGMIHPNISMRVSPDVD